MKTIGTCTSLTGQPLFWILVRTLTLIRRQLLDRDHLGQASSVNGQIRDRKPHRVYDPYIITYIDQAFTNTSVVIKIQFGQES